MGKKSGPPAPDYAAAAEQTAAGNQAQNAQQTWANRPNMTTPWGSQTWTAGQGTDPATGQPVTTWNSNVSLAPEQQQALESQNRIQQGRSNLAEGLVSQAGQSLTTPMNWGGAPAPAQNVQSPWGNGGQQGGGKNGGGSPPQFQGGQQGGGKNGGGSPPQFQGGPSRLPDARSVNQSFSTQGTGTQRVDPNAYGAVQQNDGARWDVQRGLGVDPNRTAQTRDVQNTAANSGSIQGQIGGAGTQNSIADAGPLSRDTQTDAAGFRQQGQDAVWNLQKPMLQEQQADLENQLANQGLARGSEAWTREMRSMGDRTARAQLQAVAAGRDEANSMFNNDLNRNQFINSAQGQQFNQNMGQADLFNRAENQAFSFGAQQGQFANQAQNQQYNQNMGAAELFNRANQQGFNQDNAATGQVFGQNLQAGQFANQAQGQGYNQDLSTDQFNNAAQQQRFSQGNQAVGTNNAAAGQQFQQNMGRAAFENQSGQQNFSNLMEQARMGDQRASQQLDMAIRAGNFNNGNRAQSLQEMISQRSQPLNDLNALLGGQQVTAPNFGNFSQAGRAAGTDYSGAAGQQYGANVNSYNANVGGINNLVSGAASFLPFLFSDARLKEDIQTVGILRNGVRVVHYRYRGLSGRHVGVIAQELAEIQPEAVAMHPSGYLMVDYSKVSLQ